MALQSEHFAEVSLLTNEVSDEGHGDEDGTGVPFEVIWMTDDRVKEKDQGYADGEFHPAEVFYGDFAVAGESVEGLEAMPDEGGEETDSEEEDS